MHDSTTVHLHIIQQSTVLQAIWIVADKANSSQIPAWQGDCAWNHAKHMSSWLDVHSSVRYTHNGVCIFYVCVCACVCVGPWLTGCWHILITLGSCCFWPRVAGCGSSTSHILTIFYYQQLMECLIMTMSLKKPFFYQSGKWLSFKPVQCIVYIYKLDSANNIMDYIIWKNNFHLFTGSFIIISSNKCNTSLNIYV